MKLYIGVNSDGTEIISKLPIKRFFDEKTNETDVFCYNDTKQPPHWFIDYSKTDIHISKWGHNPVDEYLTFPSGALKKMFGVDLTWNDEFKEIEL